MIRAPLPENEDERLRWLEELNILDTIEEQAYDDLTFLAAQICGTPIALVSLIDRDRQWFKSHHDLDARETPRDYAFCAHAILGDEPLVVEDSAQDERFHDNPLAIGAPHVKFYAGAPLILRDGIRLGTLCVIDNRARTITPQQTEALKALARQVVDQMELRLKLREMQRLDCAKDEFISMVNHELRTPLTSIHGALTLLDHVVDKSATNAQTNDLVSIATRNADRLLCIVNDILDIAKLEAGKLELDLKLLDLTELAKRAVELNRLYCESCGCDIEIDPEGDDRPLMVTGDENRLLQVLGNLISNAAKFTRDGDTIQVLLQTDGASAQVSVTDHGPGIPPEREEHLFDKFSQIDSGGKGKLPGTGLGLNLSKHIVERHQGSMGCNSIPNEFTSFYFTLPLAGEESLSG